MASSNIPHVAMTLDENNHLEGSLAKLLAVIRPDWSADKLTVTRFTEGLTNQLYGVTEADHTETVLVRIFGIQSEKFIDRAMELKTIQLLTEHDCAKPVHCTFDNGLCYGFQEGNVISEEEMRTEHSAGLIAKELARLHAIPVPDHYAPEQKRSAFFLSYFNLLKLLPDHLSDPDENQLFKSEFLSREELAADGHELEKIAVGFNEDLVLCHHDLMNRNIVLAPSGDKVFFIDHESAGLSYAALDISAHFLSYVGISNPDFNLYPSPERQFYFIKTYLTERQSLQGIDAEVTDTAVETLIKQVNPMNLMILLNTTVWCAVQADISLIEFPYLAGAILTMNTYKRFKEDLLST